MTSGAATLVQSRWRGRKGRQRAKLLARQYHKEMPRLWAETATKVERMDEKLTLLLNALQQSQLGTHAAPNPGLPASPVRNK